MRTSFFLIAFLLFTAEVFSQNLLVNPSAESGDPTSVGWTNVSMGSTGASCYNNSGWRILGNQNGFPAAQQGSYIFYAGCSNSTGSTFEVRQDVNVSANASLIDAGWNSFTFSGYMQVYTQTPTDQSQIIVEYRDAANTTVLASYNTGLVSNQGTWTLYTNSKLAPVGTRYIRVRLLAKLNGGPSIDGYFDNLSLTTSIPLPVIISSFDVVAENTDVKLIWTTSTENDNNYFTVQRSQNATDWTDLEKVQAISNGGSGATYTAYDDNPLTGILYYRLKQTDFTGKSTYSEIKEINFTQSFADVIVFPNPAKGFFTISESEIKNLQVAVYNNIGQIIILPHTAQNNSITFNTSALSKGIYYIRLSNTHTTEIRKIVVE